ncbi:hypothetical protein EZS27_003596 [termite gut metagenome]|uniref:Uncharacterized protein n=1 Tax=termite gut metagenome TaxID=433724 RepID=A0A5J4SS79_9ZZZZ
MIIQYYVDGSLLEALTTANEIYAETGLLPDKIVTQKKEKILFKKEDYHLLRKEIIDEETYIANNPM